MKRYLMLPLWIAMPAALVAQDPVSRLQDVLPSAVAAQVMATVEDAVARGLPGRAIAERALEGAAKGRSGDEVVAAARQLVEGLATARGALESGGWTPDANEIAAAATAMQLGVDGQAVSVLAASALSGQSLAVPLAVLGMLTDRGLPSDQALARVRERLEMRAGDVELAALPERLGFTPAGFAIPVVGGLGIPFGPPPGVPGNRGMRGDRPGRSIGLPVPPGVPPAF